ncbi:tol-pal system protein YbgF [Rhodospira trueperi]|uniref:Cell division coordinator CpoB n=1 Tax=Rhodospira trueperi TaxID=69960 RepID=A0A1G7B0J8_9PROT|nr:tol-pal system protein YbgF [Rhodospira trueperi]SDE20609.1 tol-pal system protein YbgF [Rhodospira trueperi]
MTRSIVATPQSRPLRAVTQTAADRLSRGVVVVCVAASVLLATPALAQQDSRSLIAEMQIRITQLEDLVRSQTGELEQARYQIRQLEQRIDLLERTQDMALGGTAGGQAPTAMSGPGVPSGSGAMDGGPRSLAPDTGVLGYIERPAPGSAGLDSPALPSAAANQAVLPSGLPEEQYQHAFSLLREGNYAAAERAFSEFVERYPQNTLAGNAQYWLGETYYARGDYEAAAVAFAKGYREFQDGTKTPDNLFKLGMSMSALGRKREACAAFQKLRADYPNVAGTLQRQVSDQMARNGC